MGFFSSLVDSFTGKSAQRELDKGIKAVSAGRDQAVDAYKMYGENAKGYLSPYVDQGAKSFSLYGDTLGLNGAGARSTAQDLYLSDDILQKQLGLQQRNRGWASNARGAWGSGADALAANRVNLQAYGDWQNRLAGVGQQGQQAATTAAGLEQNTGAGIANAYQNATGQTASLYGQKAQASNALAQNVIGVGSVVASAFNPLAGGVNNLLRPRSGSAGGYG